MALNISVKITDLFENRPLPDTSIDISISAENTRINVVIDVKKPIMQDKAQTKLKDNGLGKTKDIRAQGGAQDSCEEAFWRSNGPGYSGLRQTPQPSGGVRASLAYNVTGNLSVADRQQINAKDNSLTALLELTNGLRALVHVEGPPHSCWDGARQLQQGCRSSELSLLPLSAPCCASATKGEIDQYRDLNTIVRTPAGLPDGLTVSMDTCADGSIIKKKMAISLGVYQQLNPRNSKELRLPGGLKVRSDGTVKIAFRPRCKAEYIEEDFHVVDELPGHLAILSVTLTKHLGHLIRVICPGCKDKGWQEVKKSGQ
ncbi:hypothetical protein HRR83_007659 [Exophiala dermatitidis]|nr:hypothetical protein, variant [Exophiala dermatitidis NIH/UT8656]KAJ4507813.1 hypothetical protein HRR75_006523 [Exophiala dermatitidis]EHY52790.1 hypothetical protein, variant [Exophiala dermatitidis NIH/UT8656]KAJ4509952.1 hypothetical protein HRR74_007104 [Exophiala dermatitidis]KAJ4521797.1 hypothetical protein HRR73_002995 [Exophiala dermatitidis]KAJ4539492.1 hypothetical protein HRR77_006375 [Exophiala dermatitidis]